MTDLDLMPDLVPVTSSNLEAVGYDTKRKRLTVKFKNGGTYHYHEVDPTHYHKLISSESPGSYLNKHLKGRHGFARADQH